MKHKIYSVYDQKAEAYLPPFFLPAKGVAIRTFSEACNDPEHQFGKYPADYTLMELGTFDDSTALIDPYSPAITIGTGVEFQETKPNPLKVV